MIPPPGLVDHLFVFVFALVYPALGYVSFRRLMQRVRAGERVARDRLYANTVIGHWLLCIAAIGIWLGSARSLSTLGLTLKPGSGFLLSAAVTVAAIGFLLAQLRSAKRAGPSDLEAAFRAFGRLRPLLPRNRRELHAFYAVGLTAGIVEEILWRGYLLAYLTAFLPVGTAAALVIVGFGAAHAYQGAASVPRVTLVGAVFTGLYLLSGSLWLPMLLHAAVDVLQGRTAFEVLRRR